MDALRPIDLWFLDEILPHEPIFRAKARTLANSDEEASDLLQEAFAKLMSVDGWQAIECPRAYTLSILRNLAIKRLRRAKLIEFRQLADAGRDEPADIAPDAFQILAGRDQVRLVLEIIDALPERNRRVVRMRRIEGKSLKQIAESLRLSQSTVEKRLARGLELLTRALERADRISVFRDTSATSGRRTG
ncbi:RNA polymerase sigma factor [Stakelama saccharophila]|uniref:RNA polymerase sigma factor n=1 Tax=Stakelama saccharophila TaxID=3075605 RepID=A0ABZ0B586_9SPHN|nr:RNA polymerase sigma factor [Stakelama sp. W311]WNO52412.1 RNA polymerase sigma factor [Stakelama sp. W311]